MTTKLDHALHLASNGFRIFPLSPNSKVPPKDLEWRKVATTDLDAIRRWWDANPNFNIGVAAGAGTIIVDADTKDGKPGLESLEALEMCGLPTDSLRVATPSGGVHVYLRSDAPHRNSVDKMPDYRGIDIRADGGYVVGPGSTIDGTTYEVVGKSTEVRPSPTWFDEYLVNLQPQHAPRTDTPVVELDQQRHIDQAIEYLVERAPEAIEGAGGDQTTFEVASACRDYGLSEGMTLDVLLEHWNEAKASPPWQPEDLAEKVANAYRYATGTWGGRSLEAELSAFGVVDIGEDEEPTATSKTKPGKKFAFSPWVPRIPQEIPPRRWLYGKELMSGYVSLTVAPGGVGKSALKISEGLAMASGYPLLGVKPIRKLRVAMWNGEDTQDELDRRVAAALLHFELAAHEIADRLFVDTGRQIPLKLTVPQQHGFAIAKPVVEGLVAAIVEAGIDVLVIDPFVTTHGVPENDNSAINMVASEWRDIADRTGCAIDLVHHAVKAARLPGQGEALGATQTRGGGALIDAARVERHLVPMSDEEARKLGVIEEHRRLHFRVIDGKANMAPPADRSVWRRFVSVPLGNPTEDYPDGDEIGVVEAWVPPSPLAGVDEDVLPEVQARLRQGQWRKDEQAADWAGYLVADVLDISIGGAKREERDAAEEMNRHRVRGLLREWTAKGDIIVTKGRDPKNRRDTKFLWPKAA